MALVKRTWCAALLMFAACGSEKSTPAPTETLPTADEVDVPPEVAPLTTGEKKQKEPEEAKEPEPRRSRWDPRADMPHLASTEPELRHMIDELIASMMNFDASYLVRAEWVGSEMLDFQGRQIEAWLVDIEWHHQELGDIYPPGPNASGGRYWVVPDPPDGFPYVPRYKTDTYAVEFIESVCPRMPE